MTNQIEVNGDTPQERLDSLGIDEISNLVSNGVRLRTNTTAKSVGLLNTLEVSQQEFNIWLSGQDAEKQLAFGNSLGLGVKAIANDLLYRSIDVIDDIQEMLDNPKERAPTKREDQRMALLKLKHSFSNETLKQLVLLQKATERPSDQGVIETVPQSAQPKASVVMTESQKRVVAKMNGGSNE